MPQLYPDISEKKQSPNIYPVLPAFEENASSFTSKPVLRKHPETQKKPKLKVTENKDGTKGSSWNIYQYIIFIITFFSSIYFLLQKCIYSLFQLPESSQALPQYIKEIEKLKPDYGQQTKDFWNIIKSFPYFLLSDRNPEGPAVLLMVASAGSLNLALQLSHQLAHTFNKLLTSYPKPFHVINGTSLTVLSPDVQKMMIDEQIRTLVDNKGQRAVVVANLEKIDPEAIMIFHAYCDNSEAVYKNIAIILLLELPPGVYAKNNADVYAHLLQIWSVLGQSRNHALFSRMANNIAILKAK